MRVLVTGGAGFIGSNIVKLLESKGSKVVVLDNFSCADYKNLLDTKADVVCADVADPLVFRKLPKFDAVIHEAAITDTTLADNAKMMQVNFNGSENVLGFCFRKKIKLVYASSAGVYGNCKSPAKESQKLIPHNTYAYSKYLFDCLVQKTIKKVRTPLIVGMRYFNVYGPGEAHKGAAASMTYQLYLQMKKGKRPRVFKSGEQKRDFIYVKDVARITVGAIESKKSAILNLGTGRARSFNNIISGLNKGLKKNLKADYFDNPFADKYQNFTQADVTLLKKTLNTTAQFSLEQGISDYIGGYL